MSDDYLSALMGIEPHTQEEKKRLLENGCKYCPEAVECPNDKKRNCQMCGWNPAVANRRKKLIRKELQNVH